MGKEIFKKVLVASVVSLFLSTMFVTANDGFQPIKIVQNENDNIKSKLSVNESTCRTFIVEIGPRSEGNKNPGMTSSEYGQETPNFRYDVQLSADGADKLLHDLEMLDIELADAETPSELMGIIKEKLRTLRDAGIFPSSFTLENMTKTGNMLRDVLYDSLNFDAFNGMKINTTMQTETSHTTELNTPRLKIGRAFIGLGSIFFYLSGGGVGFPLSYPFLNSSGKPILVFGGASDPLPIFPRINLSVFVAGGGALNVVQFLAVPSVFTIAYSFSALSIGGSSRLFFGDAWLKGSFLSIWGPHIVGSVTVYLLMANMTQHLPIVELGIFGSLGEIVVPIWYEIVDEN